MCVITYINCIYIHVLQHAREPVIEDTSAVSKEDHDMLAAETSELVSRKVKVSTHARACV
jgi:hypothetical protein